MLVDRKDTRVAAPIPNVYEEGTRATRVAILARRERSFERLGDHRMEVDPERPPRLRRRGPEPHPAPLLVVVADERLVDGGDAGAAPVKPEVREPVLPRQEPEDGLAVSTGRARAHGGSGVVAGRSPGRTRGGGRRRRGRLRLTDGSKERKAVHVYP